MLALADRVFVTATNQAIGTNAPALKASMTVPTPLQTTDHPKHDGHLSSHSSELVKRKF